MAPTQKVSAALPAARSGPFNIAAENHSAPDGSQGYGRSPHDVFRFRFRKLLRKPDHFRRPRLTLILERTAQPSMDCLRRRRNLRGKALARGRARRTVSQEVLVGVSALEAFSFVNHITWMPALRAGSIAKPTRRSPGALDS